MFCTILQYKIKKITRNDDWNWLPDLFKHFDYFMCFILHLNRILFYVILFYYFVICIT